MEASFVASFLLTLILFPSFSSSLLGDSIEKVKVGRRQGKLVIDNGLVQLHFTTPRGFLTQIKYTGRHEILAPNEVFDRGYWDIVWNNPSSSNTSTISRIVGTRLRVLEESENKVEISFSSKWDDNSGLSLDIDTRFVLLAGESGFYTYAIFERDIGRPVLNVDQIRMVFKLRDKFKYMALSDKRQRIMPRAVDRVRGEPLAYPEAVLLTDRDPEVHHEVDDKYQYSCDNWENRVHGWVAPNVGIGFWVITVANEFKPGGPLRQDLTSHVGPISLSSFSSLHYVGEDGRMKFEDGEEWRFVFGPVFIYMNHRFPFSNPRHLWNDAKSQMVRERAKWPYSFPLSSYFPKSEERGIAVGRIVVCDLFLMNDDVCTFRPSAHLGLARPGPPGSWQTENKGYQFWTTADDHGRFVIKAVRAGNYSLYGWVLGVVGDFMHNSTVTIIPGVTTELGTIEFWPDRMGPTIWEIGVADRTGKEFAIPNPDPRYVNQLYLKHDRFRQYGLWERYTALYPTEDLVFVVGVHDFRKDWFFAQVPRMVGEDELQGTTWRILFRLDRVYTSGLYVLRLALGSCHISSLEVRFNCGARDKPDLSTGLMGKDNAIARHGIHGVYRLFSVEVEGRRLFEGWNTIYLTQTRNSSRFQGIIYDYIRLEG